MPGRATWHEYDLLKLNCGSRSYYWVRISRMCPCLISRNKSCGLINEKTSAFSEIPDLVQLPGTNVSLNIKNLTPCLILSIVGIRKKDQNFLAATSSPRIPSAQPGRNTDPAALVVGIVVTGTWVGGAAFVVVTA